MSIPRPSDQNNLQLQSNEKWNRCCFGRQSVREELKARTLDKFFSHLRNGELEAADDQQND